MPKEHVDVRGSIRCAGMESNGLMTDNEFLAVVSFRFSSQVMSADIPFPCNICDFGLGTFFTKNGNSEMSSFIYGWPVSHRRNFS